MTIDQKMDALINKHGVGDVLAALCRQAKNRGMPVLFRKLNRVYEWLVAV